MLETRPRVERNAVVEGIVQIETRAETSPGTTNLRETGASVTIIYLPN